MEKALSELAWRLDDYLEAGHEPPERVLANPHTSEGEMMTDEEVEEYIRESVRVLKVLQDQASKRFVRAQQMFFADLEFLLSIGRIEPSDYNDIKQVENYQF